MTDVKALARICDELNEPSLKRVAEWRENALQWKYVADENCQEGRINGLGFIYDNHQCRFLPKLSQEIDLSLAGCKVSGWHCLSKTPLTQFINSLSDNGDESLFLFGRL